MSTDLAPQNRALPVRWSSEQTDIIRRIVAPEHNDAELAFFAEVCKHKGLDPFAGQICTWKAAGKIVIVETTAGLRAVAQRTGLYAGQDEPLWRAKGGPWTDTWDEPGPPHACKVAVYRTDWVRPVIGKAHYAEFVQLGSDGKPRNQWQTAPANMLAKASERQALIRAFSAQMCAIGISARDMSAPSRVSMEARRAGLTDDARHALVAKVTGGRTESTTELTEDELLAMRAEVAAIGDWDAEPGYVDEDGVIHVPEPEGTQAGPGDNQSSPERRPTSSPEAAEPPAPDDKPYITRLGEWNRRATPEQRAWIHDWLRAHQIEPGKALKDYSPDDLSLIVVEIERRDQLGWPDEPPQDRL